MYKMEKNMYRVLKYPLTYDTKQLIEITKPYSIMTAGMQNNKPYIWVKQKADSKECIRLRIGFYGTGEPITFGPGIHVGTIFNTFIDSLGDNDMQFVWHVFDEGWISL
jgi:hypothetical protein